MESRHEFDTRTRRTIKQDRRSKSWGWQGGGQPSAFLKDFLTTASGRFGACLLFRLASVCRLQARGTETGADTVGDQLCGLVDPSRTPLHGCVVYQDEALLAVAPGAAEACQACIRGCLRILTQKLQRRQAFISGINGRSCLSTRFWSAEFDLFIVILGTLFTGSVVPELVAK